MTSQVSNLICIDSSTHQASVSLFLNSVFVEEMISQEQRSHSEFVTVALERLLKIHSLKPTELTKIAVTCGPGSFTGIRVAVNLAKTLSYSLNIPIWTTDTLTVLRSLVAVDKPCFVSLNAYKNLVFGSFFEASNQQGKIGVFSYENAAKLLQEKSKAQVIELVGEGTSLFSDLLQPQIEQGKLIVSSAESLPRSRHLGELYINCENCGQTMDWKLLNPLYLRGSEAEENLKIHSSEN